MILFFPLIILILTPFVFRTACDLLCFFFARRLRLSHDPQSAGSWALVTGAGTGIGRGYALSLARRGMNICLIGRTQVDLDSTASEITELGVKALKVRHEFSFNSGDDQKLRESLAPILNDVGMLVNNVGTAGLATQFSVPFLQVQPSPLMHGRNILATNCDSAILMTSIVGPAMMQRKKGAIIFVGSACGIHPLWGAGLYAASKSFIQFFAESLRQELMPHGITVQTLTPSWVKTKLIPSVARDNFPFFVAIQPEDIAESAMNTLGLQNITDGCWQHSLHNNFLRLLDRWLPTMILDGLLQKLIKCVRIVDIYYSSKKN